MSKRWGIITSLIILLLLLRFTSLRHQNLPYLLLKSFYVVYFESKVYDLGVYKEEYGIFKETNKPEVSRDKLIVVIIGESTTSNNMSLYGYENNTNPLLNQINNLNVYKDVISPHAGTTASLCKVLSLDHYEDHKDKQQGAIIQLLNANSYETYWVSNQEPVGFAETAITKVVYSAKHKFYLNTGNTEEMHLFDEVVFNTIDNVIHKKNENQVLFIHLQGTHFFYKNRYPDTYQVFKGTTSYSPFDSPKNQEIINSYDNSILYNDYIVSTIINKVKDSNKESCVIYFSDHGEEVFRTIDFSGHNDEVGTLPMFQIPFLFWQSEKFMRNNAVDISLERAYMTDDLFHSIADLCDIQDEHVSLERSIFSSKFLQRKRIILNDKDYDSLLIREIGR
ncbi:phosphoethanolamine transferase [Pseudotamlana carrageenivorans]|uniref:phosphoethanolamine transferase n=1 Tax=Pseudotamlana carrageenivorans TaxID=2069432 RepID=UPI0013159837|nr:phosphoethanolamine transferase [Tamlana carrageenivorans]